MKMKKLLLAILATAAFSGSAYAADLAARPYAKAPPMMAAAPSWTGCYIGAGWGYGMLDDDRSVSVGGTVLTTTTSSGGKGWLGRVGGGCDYQFAGATPFGPLVIGLFGDYDFADIKGNYGDPLNGNSFTGFKSGTQKISDAWYVGARAGLLVTPSVLTYVSGGWTGAHVDAINLNFLNGTFSGRTLPAQNANGWFLGSGFEYAFTFLPVKGLFWRNEYRYASYSDYNQNYFSGGVPGSRVVHNSLDVQTITTSLVWRFGTP